MIRPILTLWGMYKVYPKILDNIELPREMDRDTMLDYIFMYAGNNESRYGDPELLKRLVNRWFSAKKHDFDMIWRALTIDYNPIENTDMRISGKTRTEQRREQKTEQRIVTLKEMRHKILQQTAVQAEREIIQAHPLERRNLQ